jgi:hypothetical protein
MLVNIVRWRVPKESSRKHLEFWRWWMDWQRSYQKSHPEKALLTRSRLFRFTEEGSSEENWMFLDEYEAREDFDKQMKIMREDPEIAKVVKDEVFPRWDAVILPGSRKKGEVWTEVEALTVTFRN